MQTITVLLILVGLLLAWMLGGAGTTVPGGVATSVLPRELQDALLAGALRHRMHVHTLGYRTTAVGHPTPPLLMRHIQTLSGKRSIQRVGPMRLFRRVLRTPVPLLVDPPYTGRLLVAVVNHGLPESSPLAEPVCLETGGAQGEAVTRVEITRGAVAVAPAHHPLRVTGKLFAVLFLEPVQEADGG
jgi:hypothetical protein